MRRRVCIAVASPMTVHAFLIDQITAMKSLYDVTVVLDADARSASALIDCLGVEVEAVGIDRKIAPQRDARALSSLLRLMRRKRFDLVHSVTPKAGLLAMSAAFLERPPLASGGQYPLL